MTGWRVIYRLGVKELWSLGRDPVMVVLIVYLFTVSIYSAATAMPDTLNKASIAVVDEDRSALSERIIAAFYPPHFLAPDRVSLHEIDRGLDEGRYTFGLVIPAGLQRDVLDGRQPAIQLNVDATRMSQAFAGSGYIQQIVLGEVSEFLQGHRGGDLSAPQLAIRMRFNPSLDRSWFGALMEVINSITLLSIILTGAALIREREHGTIEHLLVMPVTPFQIMASKVWSMGVVVLVAAAVSLTLIIQGVLRVPVQGSVPLFMAGAALHLFATTSMGIFMATAARTMPQFGLLLVLVVLPLELLSGASTPRESMPALVQDIMLLAPTTHFVALGQAILYRGAALDVVWPQFLALVAIGIVFFVVAWRRFRVALSQMA
ncbi:MAG: ABC transporter permease [Burkholderiaceae bacterium]